jgi:hypothetical protein
MMIRRLKGIAVVGIVALLSGTLPGGEVSAQDKAATLEPLLRAADFEKIGLKGVTLAPPDAYDRVEQLGFEIASDSTMVVVLSRIGSGDSGGTLRPVVEMLAKDPVAVSGVGDEAYSFLGGVAFAFRKGKATYQMMSGLDLANGAKPFLTKDQLAALAKVVFSRL